MKMSLARLFFLVFVLVTTVSLSMPIHSSPEHPGNVDVRWTEPPKLEPEHHPPDLVKRGIIGAVVDVIKTAIKLVQDQVNKEKDVCNRFLLLSHNPSRFTDVTV
jgi:hypothetical protein